MDKMAEPFSLAYLPLLIRLECCETAQLPAYLGSTLHGVLGWALSSHTQAYRYLFENRQFGGAKQDIVNPYILEPPRYRSTYNPGDLLCFKLILLGDAAMYAKEVIEALGKVQYFGLGASRKRFKMADILQGERFMPIWRNGQIDLHGAAMEKIPVCIQENVTWCSFHMLTPLRIRRGGELLRELDFATIVRSITRRLMALTERYGGKVDAESVLKVNQLSGQVSTASSGLYISQINRYSTRRNETMDMSGLLGAMTFEGELAPFTLWLNAARILHIGRNTTFGYGQIDVVFG